MQANGNTTNNQAGYMVMTLNSAARRWEPAALCLLGGLADAEASANYAMLVARFGDRSTVVIAPDGGILCAFPSEKVYDWVDVRFDDGFDDGV